jgi:Sec-independent protein translocase protein TatA
MGLDLETLLILAVLAFILFGPEKLPEYAATLGRFVAKMRQATTEMSRQYQDQNPFHYPPEPTLPPAPESTCPYGQQPLPPNFTFCAKRGQRVK